MSEGQPPAFDPSRAAAFRFLVGHGIAVAGMVAVAIAVTFDMRVLANVANYVPLIGYLILMSGLVDESGWKFMSRFWFDHRYAFGFVWGKRGWEPAVSATNLSPTVVGLRWPVLALTLASFAVAAVQMFRESPLAL